MTNVKNADAARPKAGRCSDSFLDLIPGYLSPMSRHSTLSVLAIAAAATLSALFAAPAAAQSEPYYYLGLSGGQPRGQIDESRTSNRLIGPGLTINSITIDVEVTGTR